MLLSFNFKYTGRFGHNRIFSPRFCPKGVLSFRLISVRRIPYRLGLGLRFGLWLGFGMVRRGVGVGFRRYEIRRIEIRRNELEPSLRYRCKSKS